MAGTSVGVSCLGCTTKEEVQRTASPGREVEAYPCPDWEGDIDRREYLQESDLTKAALDATRVSTHDEVVRYGGHIEGLLRPGERLRRRNATNC